MVNHKLGTIVKADYSHSIFEWDIMIKYLTNVSCTYIHAITRQKRLAYLCLTNSDEGFDRKNLYWYMSHHESVPPELKEILGN